MSTYQSFNNVFILKYKNWKIFQKIAMSISYILTLFVLTFCAFSVEVDFNWHFQGEKDAFDIIFDPSKPGMDGVFFANH